MTAALVVASVAKLSGRPLLVAIDGPSAAGTTTLAAALAPLLDAVVVHGDDFYRDLPFAQRWALDAVAGADQYFDWQRMRSEALEPLKAGRSARYLPFNWAADGGLADEPIVIEAAEIVVVEGVYAARPEFRDLIDLAVLVDTPARERHRRLVIRSHGNDTWWSRWSAAEDHYYDVIRPPFDLTVPGA